MLFAVMSTACVSKPSRKTLERAVRRDRTSAPEPEAPEEGQSESEPGEEEEVDICLRRDPWLVCWRRSIHSETYLIMSGSCR